MNDAVNFGRRGLPVDSERHADRANHCWTAQPPEDGRAGKPLTKAKAVCGGTVLPVDGTA
jgi:hypothetical protein